VSDFDNWPANYFNYFTEIEEHFQRARGTGLFLLSPLDWALIETWKNAGVPLAAVLRGVDAAFEKWRSRKSRMESINSLAWCAQAVMLEADKLAAAGPGADLSQARPAAPVFPLEDLRDYLARNAGALRNAGQPDLAASVDALAAEAERYLHDLEPLEQHLTALEGNLIARLTAAQSEQDSLAARRELDRQLRPYRSKMTAPQLAMLERQYLERRLLEQAGLPRLSLFYMR